VFVSIIGYRAYIGYIAPVNKLVPETSLSWALYKYGVYDYDYTHGRILFGSGFKTVCTRDP